MSNIFEKSTDRINTSSQGTYKTKLNAELQLADLKIERFKKAIHDYEKWIWIVTSLQQSANTDHTIQIEEELSKIDSLKLECFELKKMFCKAKHRQREIMQEINEIQTKNKVWIDNLKHQHKKDLKFEIEKLEETAVSLSNEVILLRLEY